MVFKKTKSSLLIPVPSCVTYAWGFGSLLGMSLAIQLLSGVMLSFSYESSLDCSFESVVRTCQDVQGGWLFRAIHANGASFYFVLMYVHIGRGMYYGGYKNSAAWTVGVTILLLSMGAAFLGYVLPWGQMSLWGATVITNLLSAFPYVGTQLVLWLWGGFSVSGPTLTRFFSLHFLLPFAVLALVILHLMMLHSKGSSNPLGVSEQSDKIPFHPYFTYKDMMGVAVYLFVSVSVVLLWPDVFMDPDNSLLANSLVTPPHIQPEWYFLFAYAILRSIPTKLGGVLGLLLSIVVLYLAPFKHEKTARYSVVSKGLVVMLFVLLFLLTWVGAMPAAYPLVTLGKVLTVMYFSSLVIWLWW